MAIETARHQGALRIAPTIARKLFSDINSFRDKTGKVFRINRLAGGRVRGVTIGHYSMITQNPTKRSGWAEQARRGAKIVWVIYRPPGKLDRYVGRVHEGVVTAL